MYSVCIKFARHNLQDSFHGCVCNSWFTNGSSYVTLRYVYNCVCIRCLAPVVNWLSTSARSWGKYLHCCCHVILNFKNILPKEKWHFSKVCYHMACENLKVSCSHQASLCVCHVVRGMKFIVSFMKLS